MALVTAPGNDQDELAKRRRKRSVALALVLGALVLIVYALTIVKLGPNVLDRPL